MKNKTVKSGSLRQKFSAYLGVALLLSAGFVGVTHRAYAATSMTASSVLETNMNAGSSSAYYVDFKAGAADSATTLTVVWPTGFTLASGSQTVDKTTCTSLFSGATGLPGTLTASGSGLTDTVSGVTALTAGTQYCFGLTGAPVTTNGAANNYNVSLADGTDSATVGIDTVSSDQINVTASVAPSFTLIFNSNTDSFTNGGTSTPLSSNGPTYTTGVGLQVKTNGANGWGLWAEDSNGGLHSSAANKTISSVALGSNANMGTGGAKGTEAYALGVETPGYYTANYADTDNQHGGGLSSTAFSEIATGTTPTSGSNLTVQEIADISGTTPAATDYTDTITIVGDGSF